MTEKYGNVLDENGIICQQVNCMGVMGAGLAKQVRSRYPEVYKAYRSFCEEYGAEGVWNMTTLLICPTHDGKKIANIFAQFDYGTKCRKTDYERLRKAFRQINREYKGSDVAVPYGIGCGLAGGDWAVVSKIIEEELTDVNLTIVKYKV